MNRPPQEFTSNGAFARHKRRKHFWGVFACAECGFKANFASDLVEHMRGEGHGGEDPEVRDDSYKNRSSRKIDSQRLFSREYDFPETFSLTENQFSPKTYFYTNHP